MIYCSSDVSTMPLIDAKRFLRQCDDVKEDNLTGVMIYVFVIVSNEYTFLEL